MNSSQVILDAVGPDRLEDLGRDLMALLDSSVAVYEANGDFAFRLFESGWCRLLDNASFALCNTESAQEALGCGEWLCHENCWNDSARAALESGVPTDIDCVGGLRLYAVPILVGDEAVGVVNMGYGTPPRDESTLVELSETYQVELTELRRQAENHKPRPEFIIQLAKRRCEMMARMIAEAVERRRYEKEVLAANERLVAANQQLRATEQRLRATSQKLEASNQQLRAANHRLRVSEEQTRESERRYRMAQKLAGVGVWTWEIETDEVQLSDETLRFFGFEPGSFGGDRQEMEERIHPDDLDAWREDVRACLEDGKQHSTEFRVLLPGGGERRMSALGDAERDSTGKAVRMRGLVLDVTEPHRIQEELARAKATLQAALDNSQAGIAIADAPDGRLRYVNRAGLMIRGESPEEIVSGIGVNEYVSSWQILDLDGTPLEREEVPLARAILFGERNSREFIVRRSDEEDRIVWANAAPIMNQDGSVASAIVVFLDITDRVQAERELSKKNALFRESRKALRGLTHRIQAIREQEREALARDLHDELGEALTIHRMDLDQIRQEAETTGSSLQPSIKAVLDSADAAIDLIRDYCMQLHSPVLDLMGVGAAIRSHAELVASRSGMRFEMDVIEENLNLGPEVEINLFRVAQEALTNVIRHAKARRVSVSLGRDGGGRITLVVADDGVGIPEDAITAGQSLGILGMRERAMAIGGRLLVEKGETGGTEVRLELGSAS